MKHVYIYILKILVCCQHVFFCQVNIATNDQELSTVLSTDEGLDILESIGFRGDPKKATMHDKHALLE